MRRISADINLQSQVLLIAHDSLPEDNVGLANVLQITIVVKCRNY